MVLLRLEIINDYWVIERHPEYDKKGNNEYIYKRKGYWDSYNLLKAFPVIYWEQPLSFEQFANNIWANGFVALLDAPSGIGPKQRAEFVFAPPFIPDNCIVTCRIAYNGTGLLFRFQDLINPNSIRQIRVTGATYDHPHGSVIFSILHSHPLREDIYTWNWSSCAYSSPHSLAIPTRNLIRSSSSLFDRINLSSLIKSGEKVYYDLDFRLDSKYTTQIYPLIIHPLNRFYDLNSYYMAELSEICIHNQGFSDIKISLQLAEECYNKMYRLFTTYPFLIRFLIWLKTPSKFNQQKLYKRRLKSSYPFKQNSSYYLNDQNSFMDTHNFSQEYYNSNRSNSRYNMNDINHMSFTNNPNDYNTRRNSFINPGGMNMSQLPNYNLNIEGFYNNRNGSNDQLNGLFLERSLYLNEDDLYEYQTKRIEIMKMKYIIEKLAILVKYLQYSSPFLLTALLLYIYKKRAREWFVLFKCAYQLLTYQLNNPYVVATSPQANRHIKKK